MSVIFEQGGTGAPNPPRRLLEIKIYLPYIPGGKK